MTPMIDVVFLLLIFFVWTSSFAIPESDLPSSIATTETAGGGGESTTTVQAEAFDELVITIAADGASTTIRLNQQQVTDVSDLKRRLREIFSLDVQPAVIVDPEPQVTMADAVAVFDAVRSSGANRVLFAIEAE